MAATAALIGYGSTLQVSNNTGSSPDNFTTFSEIYNITPPSDTIDIIDATHMLSPNATREFILGLNDPGECSFEMNFIPGNADDVFLQAWKAARERRNCIITFPNNASWEFEAILTGYEPDVPTEDKMTATVTMKVTGSYGVSP